MRQSSNGSMGASSRAQNRWKGIEMKSFILVLAGLVLLEAPAVAQLRNIDLGATISDGGLRSFYLAMSDYYRVPERQILEIRDRQRISDDDLPVAFFLAARARVQPSVIIDLRIGRRMSWFDISLHYGLTPDIFFMPVGAERIGPPYGNAYGYYRKYGPSKEWKKFRLSDREVVDLVSLRFMSEYHKRTPEDIIGMIEMRGLQSGFVAIHNEILKAKSALNPGKQNPAAKGNADKSKPNPGKGSQNQGTPGNSKKSK